MSHKAAWSHARRLAGTTVFAGTLIAGIQVARADLPVFSFDSTNFDQTVLDTSFALTLYGSGNSISSIAGVYDGVTLSSPIFESVSGSYTGSGASAVLASLDIVFQNAGIKFNDSLPVGLLTTSGYPVTTSGDMISFVNGKLVGFNVEFNAVAAPEINGAVLPRAVAALAGVLFLMLRFRRRGGTRGLPV
jgi:hypothetical protein